MKKKLLSILIATTLVASLTTGCGNKSTETNSQTVETTDEAATTDDKSDLDDESVEETSTKDVSYYTEHIEEILPSSEIMSVKMVSTTASNTEGTDDFKMEILMENIDTGSLFNFSMGTGEMSMLTVGDDVYASYADGENTISGKVTLKEGETTDDVKDQAGSNDFTFTKIIDNLVSVDSVESLDNENVITATFKDLAADENNNENITITDDIDTDDIATDNTDTDNTDTENDNEEDNTSDVETDTETEVRDIQVKIYVDAKTDEFHKLTFTVEDEGTTGDCEMYIAKELSKTIDDFGTDEISSDDVAGMMISLIFGDISTGDGNEIDFSDVNSGITEETTDSVE